MAHVEERIGKNGEKTYKVCIRLKGHDTITKSFADRPTAEIWAKYKEMLIKELEDFEAQDRHLYTVEDVLVAKYSENSKEVSACRGHIYEIMQTPIAELTSESLLRYGKRLLATPIYRGGGVTSEGVRRGERKLPEPVTVLRKFAYLSSAINHAVKAGAKLENPCKMVITYIREMDKKTS